MAIQFRTADNFREEDLPLPVAPPADQKLYDGHDHAYEAPADDPACSKALADLKGVYSSWLYLPDPGIIEVGLATYAANRIDGDPVWITAIGGPSGGKTEGLVPMLNLPHMYMASTLTEASLLSGVSNKERTAKSTGGLLREIGEFGIILAKNFTSVLSMGRDPLKALLAALREIYDGRWIRRVGVDGGKTLDWRGKVGMIACVTSAIDEHHSITSAMGERFVNCRLAPTNGDLQGRTAFNTTEHVATMRDELAKAVGEFIGGIDFEKPPTLEAADEDWLVPLADLVARSRSAVTRDGYKREIELVHHAEAPARLVRILSQLSRGLKLIGASPRRQRQLVVKIGMDCIPPVRRSIIDYLMTKPGTEIEIAAAIGNYSATTTRRTLEDLRAHKVVTKVESNSKWMVENYWRDRHLLATGAFPKSTKLAS